MGDEGYDDQFNDGLFRTTLNASRRAQPHHWPRSVSEMRGHTDYGGQGMAPNHDTGLSDYVARTSVYHHHPRFYKPFWHEPGNPKTAVWHLQNAYDINGHNPNWYWDTTGRGGQVWIDGSTR